MAKAQEREGMIIPSKHLSPEEQAAQVETIRRRQRERLAREKPIAAMIDQFLQWLRRLAA